MIIYIYAKLKDKLIGTNEKISYNNNFERAFSERAGIFRLKSRSQVVCGCRSNQGISSPGC